MNKKPRRDTETPRPTAEPAPQEAVRRMTDTEQYRLGTTLMLAGKMLAARYGQGEPPLSAVSHARPIPQANPALLDDFGRLGEILDPILAWFQEEARLTELMALLRQALGDEDILRLLVRSLFPNRPPPLVRDAQGKRLLSAREVAILREAAGDRSHKEIAERLKIAPRTVDTHMDHIYKRLRVHRPLQAVARAISLGYLELDAADIVQAAGNCGSRNFEVIGTLIGGMKATEPWVAATPLKPLSEFALLLLFVCGMAGWQMSCDRPSAEIQAALVCELNAQGECVRQFHPQPLRGAGSILLAPPHAARQGFVPGHLYVGHEIYSLQSLNRGAIAEYTPDGEFVRAFCGGREIETRLMGHAGGMAFAPDGRLLAPSGYLTDAILAFGEGGATVERFANICPGQVAVGPDGRIYAIQGNSVGRSVQVLEPDGQRETVLDSPAAGVIYYGLAINSRGHLFVNRYQWDQGEIEEYDPNSALVRSIRIRGLQQTLLTTDAYDRLYVPCRHTGEIQVFSPEGTLERRIDLSAKMIPSSVAIGEGGHLWVCGLAV